MASFVATDNAVRWNYQQTRFGGKRHLLVDATRHHFIDLLFDVVQLLC
jgi:hypothetical protein